MLTLCNMRGQTYRNVDEHFSDFGSGEELLQGIEEILEKETVYW